MALLLANWKMNIRAKEACTFAYNISNFLSQNKDNNQIILFPPFTMLSDIKRIVNTQHIQLGGQNCSAAESGSLTGEVSAAMLKDAGCDYVILGHSERRIHHQESSFVIREKAATAHKNALKTIICIGESKTEYDHGITEKTLKDQLFQSLPNEATSENTIIAYEPIWAIGTGKIPTTSDIAAAIKVIQDVLQCFSFENSLTILYGGSVKSNNACEILETEGVSGLLVGNASLNYDEFTQIITKTRAQSTLCKQF